MLKLNLQLFASKKGVGSTKNGRDSHSNRLASWYVNAELRFTQETTLVLVKTTRSSLK